MKGNSTPRKTEASAEDLARSANLERAFDQRVGMHYEQFVAIVRTHY
jgi:hypothetical protein